MGAAWWWVVAGCAGAALLACDGSVRVDDMAAAESGSTATGTGGIDASTTSAGGAGAQSSSSSAGAAGGGCPVVECAPVEFSFETQCNDCIDNDGDGLIDLEDPPCFAPWAYDETKFTSAVGDDADPCRLDCAFDANYGSGNDGCEFDLECDALEPAVGCVYDATASCPPVEPSCVDVCVPIAPNGCDCFGCCELPARSGSFVFADNAACSIGPGGQPQGCAPCTPNISCINPCEPCEICLGELVPPDGCVVQACPEGHAPCGQECQPACAADEHCLGGCCARQPRGF